MKNLSKKIFDNIEEIISSFFISITVVIVIINVISRYIFKTGFYWAEEVSVIAFIWAVFIGSSACYKHKMHIGIDMVVKLFPKKIQDPITILVNLLLVVLNGYITYISLIFIRASSIKPTAVLGISSAYVSSAIFTGFLLITLHTIRFFVNDLNTLKANQSSQLK